jgi:hypothetical protein
MAIRYNYHAIFGGERSAEFCLKLVQVGAACLWRLVGQPASMMLQNFETQSAENFDFTPDALLEIAPPAENQILSIYPEKTTAGSLLIYSEEDSFVATFSIRAHALSSNMRQDFFSEIKSELVPMQLQFLVSGEELEVNASILQRVRSGKLGLMDEIEFCDRIGGGDEPGRERDAGGDLQ